MRMHAAHRLASCHKGWSALNNDCSPVATVAAGCHVDRMPLDTCRSTWHFPASSNQGPTCVSGHVPQCSMRSLVNVGSRYPVPAGCVSGLQQCNSQETLRAKLVVAWAMGGQSKWNGEEAPHSSRSRLECARFQRQMSVPHIHALYLGRPMGPFDCCADMRRLSRPPKQRNNYILIQFMP